MEQRIADCVDGWGDTESMMAANEPEGEGMESKITGYALAEGESQTDLIERVNSFMRSGYQPLGGPVVFTFPNGQQGWCQAMVLFVPVNTPRHS